MSDCCVPKESVCSCCNNQAIIPIIPTKLAFTDTLGIFKARWGIGRMNYKVDPGLYAVGAPNEESPVLVSANYKLTFDVLRKELSGIDCWLEILDTRGINVWCAAGKGTFGTEELVNRLAETRLTEKVSHKTLILPLLGASGINANEVKRRTGFSVIYGPVRARDIKAFLESGYKATEEMRTVKFSLVDRLVLTPMEIVPAVRKSLYVFGVLFLLNLVVVKPFGPSDFIAYSGAILMGAFSTPLLLPYIPGRAFSFKGGLLGLIWAAFAVWLLGFDLLATIGYVLILPAISAYLAMNFTGSSTYTSPSGVLKEMRIALPIMISATVLGVVLLLLNHVLWL